MSERSEDQEEMLAAYKRLRSEERWAALGLSLSICGILLVVGFASLLDARDYEPVGTFIFFAFALYFFWKYMKLRGRVWRMEREIIASSTLRGVMDRIREETADVEDTTQEES